MTEAAIVGVIVSGIIEVGRALFNAFKSGDVELAKRRAREASDRAVDKAFALWRLAERKKAKGQG